MKKRLLASLLILSLLLLVSSAFAWEIERPSADHLIDTRIEDTAGTNDEASVGLGVHVIRYLENAPEFEHPVYGRRDGVILRAIATANTRKGISYGSTTLPNLVDWVDAPYSTGITGDDSGA